MTEREKLLQMIAEERGELPEGIKDWSDEDVAAEAERLGAIVIDHDDMPEDAE